MIKVEYFINYYFIKRFAILIDFISKGYSVIITDFFNLNLD